MVVNDRDAAWLLDMIEIIQNLRQTLQGVTFERLLESWAMQKIVERSFEILGEASRRLSDEFRSEHPEIEWSRMIGLRNVIAHQYEDVDYLILWDIITRILPELQLQLEALLPPLPNDE